MKNKEKHCKWYNDEFCTNGDSPCVADYCPVVEYPELCKCRELDNEKEFTDEEIANAFECCNTIGMSCNDCPFEKNGDECEGVEQLTIDLIHRLQGKVAEYERKLADGEVCSMDYHEEQMGVLNCEIETYKAEIERLNLAVEGLTATNKVLDKENSELIEERENMQAEIMRFEDMKFTQEHCDLYKENEWLKASLQQVVKDTAKECYEIFKFYKQNYYDIPLDLVARDIEEKTGVEVE